MKMCAFDRIRGPSLPEFGATRQLYGQKQLIIAGMSSSKTHSLEGRSAAERAGKMDRAMRGCAERFGLWEIGKERSDVWFIVVRR